MLPQYVKLRASQLQFAYSSKGKPSLAAGSNPLDVRFNVSHSHNVALIAVTRNREIGVDVERVRDGVETQDLAERFFSPREIEVLKSLPVAAQKKAFFLCWTRKEAYLKATGDGLDVPLSEFEVAFRPDEPAALVRVEGHPEEPARWTMLDLSWDDDHAAAVVAEGRDWTPSCWDWTLAGARRA